jgi:hypothetical protein
MLTLFGPDASTGVDRAWPARLDDRGWDKKTVPQERRVL